MIDHDQKPPEEESVCFILQSITEGSQGRNVEAGTDTQAMEEMVCFFYKTQDLLLRGGWALLHQKTSQLILLTYSMGMNIQPRLSSSHGYAIDKQVQH